MKRFLAVTLAVLMGATTVSAFAQGFSDPRGRDEGNGAGEQRGGWGDGRGQDQPKPENDNGRYAGGNDGGGRGDGGRPERSQGNARGWAAEHQEQNDRNGGRGGDWRQGGGRDQGGGHTQGYGQGQGQVYGLAGQVQPNWQPQQGNGGRGDGRGQGWNGNSGDHDRGRGWGNNDHGRNNWDNGYRDGRSGWGNSGYGRGYGHDDHRNGYRWGSDWRRSWSHGWNGRHYRAPSRYYRPRGYSLSSWSIGFRLPAAYYGSSYYVDYRPYGLSPPPWGCQWVRVEGDVLLVDLATGEVIDVLYGFYY